MIKVDCEDNSDFYENIALEAAEFLRLSGEAVVELDIVSADEIHALNLSSRGVDRATDVLSFPSLEQITPFTKENYPYDYDDTAMAVRLGNIVICEDIAAAQAEEYGHSVAREKGYLFLHGLLHLLCYDHMTDEEKKEMRNVEESVLARLKLTRDTL